MIDEGRLSPQMGRLIDEAKAAALRVNRAGARAEGVALLAGDGAVFSGPAGADPDSPLSSAADAALASARDAGVTEIVAAAVAVADDPAETIYPSAEIRGCLAGIDPDLPVVVKKQGRWVLLLLSQLPPRPELKIVRVVRPDPRLLAVLEAYDLQAFGRAGLRTYDLAVLAEAGAVFAAYLGDDMVAGCQLLRMLEEPGFSYVVGFYVRPQWRGKGLGRAFLLAVADEMRKLDVEGLLLTVAPDNKPALSLYRSTGFTDEAFVPDFYGEGEDRHILRWRFDLEP
ncbi:MAG: hypothetical protein A2133_06620 [Actinobacteria bacterium RBG_16_64_13]|nr:MAG: hypothetical protein A2133_06620 [Actinobacteria bacterium RBG_16_64_13]